MSEIEGIKNFIEANKSSLENMNQEMIASHGHVPLVWLTVDEAKTLMRILYDNIEHLDCLYEFFKDDYLFLEEISNRIERVETGNE